MTRGSARLVTAAAALAVAARAQTTTYNAEAIAACRAQMPANAVFTVINGTSGATGEIVLSSSAAGLTSSATCPGYSLTSFSKHVWAIDLGDATWWGGTITAMTCAPIAASVTFDTVIHVGTGCPTSAASFGCLGGNDDNSAVCNNIPGALGTQSAYVLTNFNSGVLYALVSGYNGATGTYSFAFSYANGAYPPSPTRTGTATRSGVFSPSPSMSLSPPGTLSPSISPTRQTGTASSTGTGTASSSRTGTASSSQTRTASASHTGTPSPSHTGTPSSSQTGTGSPPATGTPSPSPTATPPPSSSGTPTGAPSRSRSPTGSRTRSGSPTPSATRSPSPSPPICRGLPAVTALVGTNGSAPLLSTASYGNAGMYTSGTCASGYRTFFPGSRLVYALYLGDGVPVGGTLTVTTCGHTAADTVLYVGTGCPTAGVSFGCLAGADDAAPPCGANGLASTLKITAAQRNYFLQLGGVNGRDVVSGLAWAYTPPPASPSGSRSPSRSRTTTRTRSRTASRSGSRSHTRKPK